MIPNLPSAIYAVVLYSYETYSYSGVEESERVLFYLEEDAKTYAAFKGLTVVHWVQDPEKQCMIEPMTVN